MTQQLILFDIDGTLLMGKGLGREATRRAMREVFGTAGIIDSSGSGSTYSFGGKTDWYTLSVVLAEHGITDDSITAQMPLYEQVLARHMAELIVDFDVVTLPGALDLLARLRQRADLVLGIVTGNVSTTVPVKLRAAGFDPDWFHVGAYGSESVNRDDLPRLALQRAVSLTQVPIGPEAVTVIGDTVDDIRCARALGARAVAVTTGFTSREDLAAAQPDHLLDSLVGLEAIIDGSY